MRMRVGIRRRAASQRALKLVAEADLIHEGILEEVELLLGLHDLKGREDVELRDQGVDGIWVEDYVQVKNELVHLLLVGGREGLEAV